MGARRDAYPSALCSPATPGIALALVVGIAVIVSCPDDAIAAPHLSIGALAGSWSPDPSLADYQMNAAPRAAWGAQVLASWDRWGGGLRGWQASTTQDHGSSAPASTVRSSSLELVGRMRIGRLWSTDVLAMASTGVLRLAWDPDRIAFDAGATPVEVRFDPITEWIGGGGLALRRSLAESWAVGFEVDHRWFGLDTSHQSGGALVTERETFGEWNARIELAWNHGLR
jgi:hypothetical protein